MKSDKKYKILLFLVILIILILLIVPGIMAVFMEEPVFSKAPGEVESWISFWGSYLGGIVGMIAVVVTTFFMIGNQNKHHNEQLEKQSEQNKLLLEEQAKHHQEQLEEQRLAIEKTAILNERTENKRIYVSFLFKKNEEVLEILMKIVGLYLERHNHIINIVQYRKVMEFLLELKSKPEKNINLEQINPERIKQDFKENIDKLNDIYVKEAKIRGDIVVLLSELRIKSNYFDSSNFNIYKFADELQASFQEIYSIMFNDDLVSDKLMEAAIKNKKHVENEVQKLLLYFTDEMKEKLKKLEVQ